MPEAADLPFAFLRDMLAQGDKPEHEATDEPRIDPTNDAAKAAMLDATVMVLTGLRQMLQAAEDLVRARRDRLRVDEPATPTPLGSPAHGRERLDLSY